MESKKVRKRDRMIEERREREREEREKREKREKREGGEKDENAFDWLRYDTSS